MGNLQVSVIGDLVDWVGGVCHGERGGALLGVMNTLLEGPIPPSRPMRKKGRREGVLDRGD